MPKITAEETRLVAEETAKKIKREAAISPSIKAIFNQIVKASGDLYAATGVILNADQFIPAWKSLLERHYRITGNQFIGEAFDIMPSPAFKAVLSSAILDWSDKHSIRQANFITQTNNEDIAKAFSRANQTIDEIATVPPGIARNQAVSRLGQRNLAGQFKSRVPTIAQTETQAAAETAKSLEAKVSSGKQVIPNQPNVVDESKRIVKKWIAVIDKRTRHNHAAANGQEVNEEDPFNVGGEKLMYPGDSSLGASLANIIMCRCNAIYSVR